MRNWRMEQNVVWNQINLNDICEEDAAKYMELWFLYIIFIDANLILTL